MNDVLSKGVVAWRRSERLRFIIIGMFNTAFGYGCFAILYLIAGRRVNYALVLVVAHFLSVANAFVWHRHVTFRSSSNWPAEFARFNLSYLGTLAFGLVALPALVAGLHVNPLVGAAITTILTVGLSYALHQRFSFRSVAGGNDLPRPGGRVRL